MNIITYKPGSDPDKTTGVILRELSKLIYKYSYLAPSGWRLIMKIQAAGDAEPYYHIDIQSTKGGGDFAEAKMSTLEQSPERAATGGDSIHELLEILKGWNGAFRYDDDISALESVDLLPKDICQWLRDEVGFAPYYGGVRIPYKNKVIEGDRISDESVEIRIVFDGASSEQNLFFALMIFRALNDSFAELYPNTQGWLDLRKLQKIPAVKFWLDLLEIKEV